MRFLARWCFVFIAVFLPIQNGWAEIKSAELPKATFQSNRFILANGLEVIHVPVHKAPVVLHMLWYHVGSKDEVEGQTGIAHFLEHLMFKRTKKYAAGEFSKEIAEIGGIENAFTTDDMTVYYQQVQKQALPKLMEREAERMQQLLFDSKEIEKERNVILEERRMRLGNVPEALLAEQMRAVFFTRHPYRHPTIGWEDDIKKLSKNDLHKFYRRWYQPQNATLVVVGDVELEKLKPLVLRYYGALKSAGINTAKQDRKTFAKEPFTQGNISIKRRDALAKATQIMQYYPAPNIANAQKPEELYSLQVLAALLGGGSSSRIYQNLVEQQKIAVAVSADYDPLSYGPSIFALGAIPRHGIEPEKLHQALNQEIQKICRMAPTENEVTHVQQTLVSNVLFAQEDLTALGTVYGRSAIIGVGPDYVENWTTNIEKTDAQSIQKSACSLISAAYSLSGTLLPEEKSSVGEIK